MAKKLVEGSKAEERLDALQDVGGGTKGPPMGGGAAIAKSTHSPGHLNITRSAVPGGKGPHKSESMTMPTKVPPVKVPPRGGY
jgi:hypothetical protein